MSVYAHMTGRVTTRTVSYAARVLGRPYRDVRADLVAAGVKIYRTPNAATSGAVRAADLERLWPGHNWGRA